jgi:glycosyltransferase involved in cell wall biosynthesis
MTRPLVSLVLPTRNGSRYLNESVQSIVDQSWTDWQLTLVNDASTDSTGALIDAWVARDARIAALHLKENVGLPRALNLGFAQARGELFTWTSDDNRYRPQALAALAGHLDAHPEIDLVYSDWSKIDDAGKVVEGVRVRPPEALPETNCVGASFLFRRNVFEALGGYDAELFLAEDYDFWLRSLVRFRLAALHEDLYEYRVHQRALTSTRQRDIRAMAMRALLRWIDSEPRPTPEQRMRALVHCSNLAWNNRRPFYARWLLWQAMIAGRSPLFYPGGRMHAVDAVLGLVVGKSLRRLMRALHPPTASSESRRKAPR